MRQLSCQEDGCPGLNRLVVAIDRYDEVLEVEPANVEAFTYRGWARWQQGDADSAADDLAEAVAIDEAYPDARVFSAVVAVNQGLVDDAAGHLVVFAALDPPPIMVDLVAQGRVRERTVELYGEQGRVTDALAFMDELIEADPDDGAVRAYRGWVLARSSVDAPDLAEPAEGHLLAAIQSFRAKVDAASTSSCWYATASPSFQVQLRSSFMSSMTSG